MKPVSLIILLSGLLASHLSFASDESLAIEACVSRSVVAQLIPSYASYNKIDAIEPSFWNSFSLDQFQNVYWYNFAAHAADGRTILGSIRMRIPKQLDLIDPEIAVKVCGAQEVSSSYGDAYFILTGEDGYEIFRKTNTLIMPLDE